MANINRLQGFLPSRYKDGSPWNGMTTTYGFSSSSAVAAYKGDVCGIDTTNRTLALTDRFAPGVLCIAAKTAAMTTTAFRGIIVGFYPTPLFSMSATASLGTLYHAASTSGYAQVVDDVNVVFEVQESGTTNYVSASNNGINKTWDIAYTAGSQVTGISQTSLDSTTAQAAAVRPFRALRYTQKVGNFNFSASDTTTYAKVDVIIANSDLAQANIGA